MSPSDVATQTSRLDRPVVLAILDGWGYAPKTADNLIGLAHTPYYDEICRYYPMTVLSAGEKVSGPEQGHLLLGTGRQAKTGPMRVAEALATGTFASNTILLDAFTKAKATGSAVHFIGLTSDAGTHSHAETLFALVRMAKATGCSEIFIHCILDGIDVPPRTADAYVEAVEIKLADIGAGTVASVCGRYFAMDTAEQWERTARAYTMLVHGEGERSTDAVSAIRNSFLRGISDEYTSPIVIEKNGVPVGLLKNGDVVVCFNHQGDGMAQLVRSLASPSAAAGKPQVDIICLTEYDKALALPVAFQAGPEKRPLTSVIAEAGIQCIRSTESVRFTHITRYFDGGSEEFYSSDDIYVSPTTAHSQPESQSFKIVDWFRKMAKEHSGSVFIVELPAVDMACEAGDPQRVVAAAQFVDTCLGGIYERVRELGGALLVTSSYARCEAIAGADGSRAFPVPFHYIDDLQTDVRLSDTAALHDVAPTLLGILGLSKPPEMTGADLRIF
jgi:2,3-bisphosphoglycerate-independent phosphoglycerate mutase